MTPPRVRVLATAAAVLLLAVLIAQLRATAPHEPAEFLAPAAPTPDDPRLLTCERSLADRPTTPEGASAGEVEPVGRISSSQVLECPQAFDGAFVTYVGEVVGDVLRRRGGAWVLMNDDAYALEVGPLPAHTELRGYNSGLAVWLDGDLADLADQPGGPRWRGDVLEVRGRLHRSDPADGGGLTLRASSGEVLVEAQRARVPLRTGQAVAAVVLAAIAVAVVVAERRAARRR